jgi:hypothetical protein
MEGLIGSGVKDPNFLLRLSFLAFVGIIAFGSVLFWRTQLLFASEYQEMPITHEQLKIKKQNLKKQGKIIERYQLLEE